MIDMNDCQPGDKLRLRNGSVVEYQGKAEEDIYLGLDHLVKYEYKHAGEGIGSRAKDGSVLAMNGAKNDLDVVEILGQVEQND